MDKIKCKFCHNNLSGPVVGHFFVCNVCQIHYNTEIPFKAVLKQSLTNMMLTCCFDREKAKRRISKAIKQFDIIKSYVSTGKLYDVGAAGGFVMKAARDRGWNVYGNELSQRAVAWAKSQYQLNIFYGFFEDDPIIQTNEFDLIIFWNTLEHIRNPIEELGLAMRTLRPGGYIHIEVPVKTSTEISRFHEAAHMVEFDNKSLDILRDLYGLIEKTRLQMKTKDGMRYVDILWEKGK